MVSSLGRPHITYEELCQLPDDGHRYELFAGQAHQLPAVTLRHQEILMNLTASFHAAVPSDAELFIAPLDIVLAEDTSLQPDLGVVLAEHADILQDVIRGIPDLVVEVLSPSTAEIDRGIKMEIYARFGVPEYWIADSEQKAIEIYRLDREAGAYGLAETCRRGSSATTPLLPALSVEVAQIFGRL